MQCICIFQYTGSEGNAYEDSLSIGFSRKQQMLHGLFLPTIFFLLMNHFNVSKMSILLQPLDVDPEDFMNYLQPYVRSYIYRKKKEAGVCIVNCYIYFVLKVSKRLVLFCGNIIRLLWKANTPFRVSFYHFVNLLIARSLC
jgi:hypothetical protein